MPVLTQSVRHYLRSIPGVRPAVLRIEDTFYPRHPERTHPVVSLGEAFPTIHRIHVRQEAPVPLPLTAELPCAPEARHLIRGVYQPPVTYGAILPDVLFCPFNAVILTDDRRVIAESIGPPHCNETLNRRPFSENRIERIDGYATPLRSHYRNHYETLIDNLPRLALLHEPPFSDLNTIKILYAGELTAMEAYLLPRLLPTNAVLRRVRSQRRLYRVESYVLSSFLTQCYGSYLPAAYVAWFRERVLPDRPSRRNRRVLVSREHAPTRRLTNHIDLVRALSPHGFESVVLELLSPQEQIELFYDAEFVVAPHGAGLANLCFGRGAGVLELYSTPNVRPCYYLLSEAFGHHYTYCLPSKDTSQNVFDDFEVDVGDVLVELSNLLDAVTDSPKAG